MKPLPGLLMVIAAGAVATRPGDEGEQITTSWTDSTQRGDTAYFTRGRVVTTLQVFTDSNWTVSPPVRLGLPNGPWNLPADSLCTLGYTGTTVNVNASTVLPILDRTRQCRARTFANVRRNRLKDASGTLSVQAARAELDTWPWAGLCSRVKDSTIIAFLIGDDVSNAEWGPAPLPVRLAQWDSIAGAIHVRCPGAPIALRALPTVLEARTSWQWLTTGWAQYTGPVRHGTPEKFFGAQVASAGRQRLGLVAGVNLLNGGCGPVERNRCLPGIPGTGAAGTGTGDYQMSAEELVYYKTVAMTEPYVCASVDWSWGPNFDSNFHQRPEIQNATKVLAKIAAARPLGSCIKR